MRDPERIDLTIDFLREVWRQNPELRLGQLLVNIRAGKEPCPEIFYFEDEELLARLQHKLWSEVFKP